VPPLGPAAAVVLFGSLAAVALAAPVPRGTRRLQPLAVGGVGLAGVGLAWAVAAPAPGYPIGAWTLPIGILAAVAEELLFRRTLYGLLAPRGEVVAVAATAMAFALLHLPLYGLAALPVDVGAGLLLSWQRWAAGTWTVPAATHAVANVLAVIR
jgi:membrane protease YdiL (CAAX protease family)